MTSPFIHYHFRLAVLLPASAQAHLERRARLGLDGIIFLADRRRGLGRAEPFNASNAPAPGQPNGSFGAAAFGSIATAGDPSLFVLAPRLKS